MIKYLGVFLFLLSSQAQAATHDIFDCIFNLARTPETQTFRVNQRIITTRAAMSYPNDHANSLIVTETTIPFEIEMNWEKFTAELTYRKAHELDKQGRAARAAQWMCFRAEIESIDGKYSNDCNDRNERNYPFEENQNRWLRAPISNGVAGWEPSEKLTGTITAADDTLSLTCTFIGSFQSSL
ncbi:MAG: hypothetical protein RJB13_2167 [Pseudomonadota bacterium]